MAALGFLESFLNALPAPVKAPLVAFTQYAFKNLRFGAPDDSPAPCENFGGGLVPFTTASIANNEIAVTHGLGRTPRLAFPILALDTVNATAPVLRVTRAADDTFVYLSSAETGVSGHLYVE